MTGPLLPRFFRLGTFSLLLGLATLCIEPANTQAEDSTKVIRDTRSSTKRKRSSKTKASPKPTRFQRTLRECNAYKGRQRRRCRARAIRQFKPSHQTKHHTTVSTERPSEPPLLTEPPSVTPPDAAESLTDLPKGRGIANLDAATCYALLSHHDILFTQLESEVAPQVEMPVRLIGPVAGITIKGPQSGEASILDCRLVVAILAWSDTLRTAHVHTLEHFSVYRAHAVVATTGKMSGHARGQAMDLSTIELDDGTKLNVLEHWQTRRRGTAPCEDYPNEPQDSQLWRRLVCDAAVRDLFQVVLTPHYDKAHANHVHLEVVPHVDWSYVR